MEDGGTGTLLGTNSSRGASELGLDQGIEKEGEGGGRKRIDTEQVI